MPLEKFEIQPLFATPYAKADLGYGITPDQIEYVQNLKMVKNQANLISENLYILKSLNCVLWLRLFRKRLIVMPAR